MIPHRFVTEYPDRCAHLLAMFEQQAREQDLLGSFALLVASAAFTIPFARMTEKGHPLGRPEQRLFSAVRRLRRCSFLDAPFWQDPRPSTFRYARIVNEPEHPHAWIDIAGNHPIHSSDMADANTVLRTIRNALAHGNVVYLDENGHERPDRHLKYIAFLSRHEENISHRVVLFSDEDFLTFLKAWIAWLQTFPPGREFLFSDAA